MQLKKIEMELSYDMCYNAHRGTSFSPEKRAESERNEFNNTLEFVFKKFSESVKIEEQKETAQRLYEKFCYSYKRLYESYLSSRNGLMSTMITGAGNFPVARMQKKNSVIDRKLKELCNYDNKLIKYINIIKKIKPEGWSELSEAKEALADLEAKQERMKGINKLIKRCKSPEQVRAKLEPLNKYSESQIVKMSTPNCYGGFGFESFSLTNNLNRIKTLKAKIETLQKQEGVKLEDNKIHDFNGFEVIENKVDGVIQFVFPGKPSDKIRTLLKSNAFRWNWKNNAWQRKLTNNAVHSTRILIRQIQEAQ